MRHANASSSKRERERSERGKCNALLHAKMLWSICSAKWVASRTRGIGHTQQTLHWKLQLQVASPNSLPPFPAPLSPSPRSTLVTLTGPIQALRCDFLRCPLAEKGIKCPLDCQHLLPFCAFCSASAFNLLLFLSFALRYSPSFSLLPFCSTRTAVASAALCDTEIWYTFTTSYTDTTYTTSLTSTTVTTTTSSTTFTTYITSTTYISSSTYATSTTPITSNTYMTSTFSTSITYITSTTSINSTTYITSATFITYTTSTNSSTPSTYITSTTSSSSTTSNTFTTYTISYILILLLFILLLLLLLLALQLLIPSPVAPVHRLFPLLPHLVALAATIYQPRRRCSAANWLC